MQIESKIDSNFTGNENLLWLQLKLFLWRLQFAVMQEIASFTGWNKLSMIDLGEKNVGKINLRKLFSVRILNFSIIFDQIEIFSHSLSNLQHNPDNCIYFTPRENTPQIK